jgi:hypothetical protein
MSSRLVLRSNSSANEAAGVPFATYLRQLSGNIEADGADTGVSANADIFQFGIGLGYRH